MKEIKFSISNITNKEYVYSQYDSTVRTNTVIGPGEQQTIAFKWRSSVIGIDTLKCSILTPIQLVDEFAFGGGDATTNPVSWVEQDPISDGAGMIPGLIALLIGAAIGGYVLFSIYNNDEQE